VKLFGLELKFNGFDIWHKGNFTPPTTLPANGGNADTVGGNLPSAFATSAQGTKADNALPANSNAVSATKLLPADTRSTNFVPTAYSGLSVHLKYNTTDGLTDGGTYHGLVNIQQWSDLSGGSTHQLGFTDNGNMFMRTATSATTWGTWFKIWNANNIIPITSGGTGASTASDVLTNLGLTATASELNYTDGVTSNIQTQLNGKTPFSTLSATTPATAGWYRIATSSVNIGANSAMFKIEFSGTGVMGRAVFIASCHNGVATGSAINQLGFSTTAGTLGLTQIRVVYHTTYTANYAYVEVYNPTALAITYTVDLINTTGWSLVTPNTAGSIPTGYTNESLTLDTGFVSAEDVTATGQLVSKAAPGTPPLVITSDTVVPNLNSSKLGGLPVNTSGTNNVANQVVRTDSNGYLNTGWINTISGTASGTLTRVYCSQDGYLRYYSPANFINSLDLAILTSPTFKGIPKSTTPTTADNSTQIATTAFVKAQGYITSAGSGAKITTDASAPSSPGPGDFWYKEL